MERDHQLAGDPRDARKERRLASARVRCLERGTEVAAELLDEVDRDARMNAPLPVEELRLVRVRHERAVPDVRVQVKAAAPIAPEGNEGLWRDVIPRQRQRRARSRLLALPCAQASSGQLLQPKR